MSSASFVFVSFVVLCTAASSAENFVFENVIDFVEYQGRPNVIPQTSLDKPVKLSVSIALINIEHVCTETKTVSLDAWLNLGWNSGITFNPGRYNNVSLVRIHPSKMWLPDLAVYNGELSLVENHLPNRMMQSSNGEAFWIPKSKVKVVCDVTDKSLTGNTTCSVKIGSWTYDSTHISLSDAPHMDVSHFDKNSKFEIVEHSAVKASFKYPCCENAYEHILFKFTFRKR